MFFVCLFVCLFFSKMSHPHFISPPPKKKKTSMMWPSQNFLLSNGTAIKIKRNERINKYKKIYFVSPPPPLWGYIQHVQIITI